jgi:hypothetical protein
MVKALLTWTADVSLVLGIAVLAVSVLLVPEVILLGENTVPHELGWGCFFCDEDDCQAKYKHPDCPMGLCPPGILACRNCRS